MIRHSAGLGKSPTQPDPDIYDHKYLHCDVLVIGGGISGIIATKIAAQNNLKTVLTAKAHNNIVWTYFKSSFAFNF